MFDDQFDDVVVDARSAFKCGHPYQSMPERKRVTEATETARVGTHRFDDGRKVDAVTVYFGRDVDVHDPDAFDEATHEALQDVADWFDLEPAEYRDDDGAVVFVPERDD